MTTAVALAFVAMTSCAPTEPTERERGGEHHAWARFATTGRHVTAPVDVGFGNGVVVGITTRGAGAVVDENGHVVDTLAGAADRRASCVLVRLDDDGTILWQTPVIAEGAQSRCLSLAVGDGGAIVARGETFDVDDRHVTVRAGDVSATLRDDEGWSVTLHDDDDDDGTHASIHASDASDAALDAVARMDACTPALSALAAAFDDVRATVRNSSGYFDLRGATLHVGAALVPQGADLDAVVPGASAPSVDESVVESVAAVVSRPR